MEFHKKNTPNKRNVMTIANVNTQELFLKKYPQYRGLIDKI